MTEVSKGIVYALVCVVLWALIPVVAKFGQSELDHHQFLFWSSLVSFLSLATLSVATKNLSNITRYSPKSWLSAIVLGLLGTYVYYLLLYKGYAEADGLSVLIVQYTWPIFVALLAPFVLKERFTRVKALALAMGALAVVLVITKGDVLAFSVQPELLWVLLGALSFALFSVFSKKVTLEPFSVNTVFFAVATLAAGASMMIESSFVWPSSSSWWPLLANGIFINGISYAFWLAALDRAPASTLATLIFITPILSTVYLFVFFEQAFLPIYFVSIVLIVVAGLITSRSR